MTIKPVPNKNKLMRTEQNKQSWNTSNFKYSSAAWIKLRNLYREQNPLCAFCLDQDNYVPMSDVDHKIPISKGGNPWDWDNLQSLCNFHHKQKSAREGKR